MSKLFKKTIRTSENNSQSVIVTTQQINNDTNGNPRHSVQVWIDRGKDGNLWTPTVAGYRRTKNDSYTITSYNIEQDIEHFLANFEVAVMVVN